MIDLNKPVTNPELLEAIAAMKNDGSSENLDHVINEVMRANFLSPVIITPLPEPDGDGKTVLKEETTISFHMITDNADNSYFPAFTDWDELRKWNKEENVQTLISSFDDYAAMILDKSGPCEGFVINPFGTNIPFSRAMIESLKNQKEKMMENGVSEHTVEKDTKVLIGQPGVYPADLVKSVTNYLKTQKNVEKAYLLLMKNEEADESSYLLVVDYSGDKNPVFGGIAKAAEPYLNGMYLDMVPYDSGFGKNAAENTEPFYKRKKFGLF